MGNSCQRETSSLLSRAHTVRRADVSKGTQTRSREIHVRCPSAGRPGTIPTGVTRRAPLRKGRRFHAKFGIWDGQVYVLAQPGCHLGDANAYLRVAVKVSMDMVNLCVRLPVTKTTTLHNVWAAPTQLKDLGRNTEVSTRKEDVCLWTAASAPCASALPHEHSRGSQFPKTEFLRYVNSPTGSVSAHKMETV